MGCRNSNIAELFLCSSGQRDHCAGNASTDEHTFNNHQCHISLEVRPTAYRAEFNTALIVLLLPGITLLLRSEKTKGRYFHITPRCL